LTGDAAQAERAIGIFRHGISLVPHLRVHPGGVAIQDCWQCSWYISPGVINLGLAYLYVNQIARAEDMLRTAVALAPWSAEAWMNLGAVLRNQRLYGEAVLSYQKALALSPSNPRIYEGLGRTYEVQGMFWDALTSFQNALAIEQGSPIAAQALKRIREQVKGTLP